VGRLAQWALVGAAWFMAASVAGFGYLLWRHSSIVSAPVAASVQGGAGLYGPNGTFAVCPVTGERVSIDGTTPKVDYLGTLYYFSRQKDSEGNDARARFLMNPEAYVHPGSAGLSPTAAAIPTSAPTPLTAPTATPTGTPR